MKCERCPYRTSTKSSLSIHMKSHVTTRPYVCPHCKMGFRTSSNMHKHVRNTHEGQRPFKVSRHFCAVPPRGTPRWALLPRAVHTSRNGPFQIFLFFSPHPTVPRVQQDVLHQGNRSEAHGDPYRIETLCLPGMHLNLQLVQRTAKAHEGHASGGTHSNGENHDGCLVGGGKHGHGRGGLQLGRVGK